MTESAELHGIMVALVTPLSQDGSQVDIEGLHRHIERMIKAGVHALVPGGSTGEFVALSGAERKRVNEECVKAANGRVPVVAGVGALSTAETIDLAIHAARTGAAAVMVVPPFYDAPNVDEVRAHLRTVHEACGLPIVYYNIPAASGVRLSAQQIADLADIEGVRYLKDTSGNATALGDLLVTKSDRITTFNGWDTLTFFGLASGATGSVWGASNIIPELSIQLWDALAVHGDLAAGRSLWAKIWPICHFLESHNYAAAVKTAMDVVGHGVGPVRKPFTMLGEAPRAEIARLLSAVGAP